MADAKSQLKTVLAILVVADIAIFGGWYAMWSQVPAGSRSWFYQSKYQITVVEHDPDFGDTSKQEFVEKGIDLCKLGEYTLSDAK